MGMGVAANHDGGALGHPEIALAQFDALASSGLGELLDGAMQEPGIGWMGGRFFLHRGVGRDPSLGLSAPVGHRKALLQKSRKFIFTKTLTRAG